MRYSLSIYAFNLILLLACNLFSQPSLAVLPFSSSGIPVQESHELTQNFRSKLNSLKKFTVLDRASMESMLSDQGFDLNDPCKEQSCAVIMGQLLSVDNIIQGNIYKVDKTYIVNLKIVNISSGSVSRDISGSYKVNHMALLYEVLPAMAQDLVSTDTEPVSIIKKKRRPLIPITIIALGTAILAIPAYLIFKNLSDEDSETRELEVQW